MSPKKECGCGFGQKSCFGNGKVNSTNQCLQDLIYYQRNTAPLTHASGFGKKPKGPMKIGIKKK